MKHLNYVVICLFIIASVACSQRSIDHASLIDKQRSHFIDHRDGTVSDSKTGLMWAKCSLGQELNSCLGNATVLDWDEAIAEAEVSTLAEYTDWRLPTEIELQTLSAQKKTDRSNVKAVFPNTPAFIFWVAPPSVDGSYYVSDPLLYYGHTDFGKPMRLVRVR